MACHLSGLSRSGLYRELAAGRIRAVKNGSATLIDMASMMAHMASLPTAIIRNAA